MKILFFEITVLNLGGPSMTMGISREKKWHAEMNPDFFLSSFASVHPSHATTELTFEIEIEHSVLCPLKRGENRERARPVFILGIRIWDLKMK